MTNSFENEKNNAIVKAQSQQLAVRNAWLVERGVHSLPIQGITECRIMEFCTILNAGGYSIPDKERTLKTIADIGSDIRSNRQYLDLLIFVLLDYYYNRFFTKWQVHCFWDGNKSNPAIRKHLMLACAALRALVGSIASPHEAIWDVLFYGTTHFPVPVASTYDLTSIGTMRFFNNRDIPYEEYIRCMAGTPGFPITDARILAIDWLLHWFPQCDYSYSRIRRAILHERADEKHRVIKTTRDLFSDYLNTMLLSTVQITPFLFKLKYADALINNHVVEAIDFYIDMIKLNKEAGNYIYSLCAVVTQDKVPYFCSKISFKTGVRAMDGLIRTGNKTLVDKFIHEVLGENYHNQNFSGI